MLIYHGSDHILEVPKYGAGRSDADYGKGFYTTRDIEKAYSWACLYGHKKAICNSYTIDTDGLNILNLDDYGILAWIAEIIENRGTKSEDVELMGTVIKENYKINTSNADIIIGYRADDSYSEVIESFLKNQLTINEVKDLFYKGDLGEQVFIKSPKAFDRLSFAGSEEVADNQKYRQQDLDARKFVFSFLKNRNNQILLDNFKPESNGLIAREVAIHKYDYNTVDGFGYYTLSENKNRMDPLKDINDEQTVDSVTDALSKLNNQRKRGGR